ncbi:MAG: anhydro-N-acetylmuramic acid kinase [Comamonadaceae bacterium]|nr:MAG: anhydro-N-acetylmuramic acid kinase [Comamonadaceae bacterium]
MPDLHIGLMSGTSLDGVDGVLADFSTAPLKVLAHAAIPFDRELKAALLSLNTPGADELHRAALAANALVRVYADAVSRLLADAGLAAPDVASIGAHGQTVRHRPGEFDGTGYTLQLNNPALLAELTGIDVVADFRSRDVAAGGQGAPLVPAFHAGVFGRPAVTVNVLNIGGISNLSVLAADGSVSGFDCGPGNSLMDYWCQRHTGNAFDAEGHWAASGVLDPLLLDTLLAEPYFAIAPPKSTGRDLFNPGWLDARLHGSAHLQPADIQATLAALTAVSCAQCVRTHGHGGRTLIVCGGGALNTHLMASLANALPGVAVESSRLHGLPPLEVEAAAFAWLARQCTRREPAGMPSVTGARGPRVLGAVFPR